MWEKGGIKQAAEKPRVIGVAAIPRVRDRHDFNDCTRTWRHPDRIGTGSAAATRFSAA
jgi:hypothetical protein